MTQQQILEEVTNSDWQPQFEFTDDLDAVVDDILKPHEDYFLGLHSKVKEIIKGEIIQAGYIKATIETQGSYFPNNYSITFADVCNWQKELFDHKKQKICQFWNKRNEKIQNRMIAQKALALPNQHINLGLRQTNVKVGEWTPPAPMFLEDLKSICFPVLVNIDDKQKLIVGNDQWYCTNDDSAEFLLTEWYKTFQTITYMEDFNYICGNITINILSYILTNKYLICRKFGKIYHW